MKHILFLSFLLVSVYAAPQDKKISLEDIERDLLSSERAPPLKTPKATGPVQSPTKFGFLPTRTAASYAQSVPKQTYSQTQYTVQNLQQNPKPQIKYVTESPKSYQQQQYSSQQYVAPEQQYAYQPIQYQQYENVQYVTDNSIGVPQEPQQYYTPQYVYVQQYQAPSTSVQTVVDPKGGVQYLMYVPAYQNSVADEQYSKYSTAGIQYDSEVPQVEQQVQYVSVPQKYTTVVQKQKQEEYAPRYSEQTVGKSQYSKGEEFVFKKEPKSLLDSYVPSILQIRYLQEAQKGLHSKRIS